MRKQINWSKKIKRWLAAGIVVSLIAGTLVLQSNPMIALAVQNPMLVQAMEVPTEIPMDVPTEMPTPEVPTKVPTETPEASEEPSETPRASEEPTKSPESSAEPAPSEEPTPSPAPEFTDVARGEGSHWAWEYIYELADRGMVQGYQDGSFRPDAYITRAEFVTILINVYGLENEGTAAMTFTDVEASDWFYAAIATATRAGLARGYWDRTFRPDNKISRQEMMVFNARVLVRERELSLPTGADATESVARFTDKSDIACWALRQVALNVDLELVVGYSDETIRPLNTITRAEVCAILLRGYRVPTPPPVTVTPSPDSPYAVTFTYRLQVYGRTLDMSSVLYEYLDEDDLYCTRPRYSQEILMGEEYITIMLSWWAPHTGVLYWIRDIEVKDNVMTINTLRLNDGFGADVMVFWNITATVARKYAPYVTEYEIIARNVRRSPDSLTVTIRESEKDRLVNKDFTPEEFGPLVREIQYSHWDFGSGRRLIVHVGSSDLESVQQQLEALSFVTNVRRGSGLGTGVRVEMVLYIDPAYNDKFDREQFAMADFNEIPDVVSIRRYQHPHVRVNAQLTLVLHTPGTENLNSLIEYVTNNVWAVETIGWVDRSWNIYHYRQVGD